MVLAVNVSGEVRSGINDYLENDLNLNVSEGLKPLTESLNVTNVKSEIPEVLLKFTTSNPKPGEKITVLATAMNIANLEDAYYTWYLKRDPKYCTEDSIAKGLDCTSFEDQKILAIRAQTALYFDPMTFDQKMNTDVEPDGKFEENYPPKTSKQQKADGYTPTLGGDGQKANEHNYCYVYDTETGEKYELNESAEVSNGCSDGYLVRCLEEKKEVQCPVNVPPIEGEITTTTTGSSSNTSSNSNTVQGTTGEFAGNEGVRFSILTQCLDSGMEAECNEDSHTYVCPTTNGNSKVTYSYGEGAKYNVPTPFCVKKNETTGQLWIDPNTKGCSSSGSENNIQDSPYPTGTAMCGVGEISVVNGNYCFNTVMCESWWDTCNADMCRRCAEEGQRLWNNPEFIRVRDPAWYNICVKNESFGECNDTGCNHYIETGDLNVPESCGIGTLSEDEKQSGCNDKSVVISVGDEFTSDEEKLYYTNPLSDKTTPLANNDGSMIAGVGMKEFSWKYQEGDEIGVIVEGVGVEATKHEDSTYQTVFAMLTPGCKGVVKSTGTYAEFINSKSIEIQTGKLDGGLEECVNKNKLYVKPGTSEYDVLTVSITSDNDVVAADTISSGLGQELNLVATANQKQGGSISELSHVYYEWDIACKVGDEYKDITEFMQKCKGMTNTEGMGLSTLKLLTDFPDGHSRVDEDAEIDELKNSNLSINQQKECYNAFANKSITNCFDGNFKGKLRVKVKVNEPRENGGTNFGKMEKEFELFNILDNPIKVYKTEITEDGKFQKIEGSDPICNIGADRIKCEVMDNEVVALEATIDGKKIANDGMVAWSVDGKKYECDTSISDDCIAQKNETDSDIVLGKSTNNIIVPLKGINGKSITVDATVNDVDIDTNESYSLSRNFEIVDLGVKIVPGTNANGEIDKNVWRKALNTYKSFSATGTTTQYSDAILEAKTGTTINLEAKLTPSFLNSLPSNDESLEFIWANNGKEIARGNIANAKNISLASVDSTVSVTVTKKMSDEDRVVFEDALNVPQSETEQKSTSAEVQIKEVDGPTTVGGVGGFFATTAHNAPEYLIFILKMTLLMGIMLFATSFVINSEINEYK